MTSQPQQDSSRHRRRAPRPERLGPSDAHPPNDELQRVQLARLIAAARRARTELFDPAMFGEPAWDMLLDLYIRQSSGSPVTVAQLLSTPELPTSTVVRWLNYLEEKGLVRRDHAVEGGSELLELTFRGRTTIDTYLDTLRGLLERATSPGGASPG